MQILWQLKSRRNLSVQLAQCVPFKHLILQSHSFHFNIGRRKTHADYFKCSHHIFVGSDQKSKRRAKQCICDQIPIYAKYKSAKKTCSGSFTCPNGQNNELYIAIHALYMLKQFHRKFRNQFLPIFLVYVMWSDIRVWDCLFCHLFTTINLSSGRNRGQSRAKPSEKFIFEFFTWFWYPLQLSCVRLQS